MKERVTLAPVFVWRCPFSNKRLFSQKKPSQVEHHLKIEVHIKMSGSEDSACLSKSLAFFEGFVEVQNWFLEAFQKFKEKKALHAFADGRTGFMISKFNRLFCAHVGIDHFPQGLVSILSVVASKTKKCNYYVPPPSKSSLRTSNRDFY
jgi:hypothetical protein